MIIKIITGALKISKIENKYYKKFLEGETIRTIPRADIIKVLDQGVKHDNLSQARALVIMAWATGRRPNEILRLKGEDIIKEANYFRVTFPGSKGGQKTTLLFNMRDKLTKELWNYIITVPPSVFLFWAFRSSRVRLGTTATVKRKTENGNYIKEKKHYDKAYKIVSDRLPYWFKKWFSVLFEGGVTPYYLRHNRASIMAEKYQASEIARVRGTSIQSTERYIHLSEKQAKKISRGLME